MSKVHVQQTQNIGEFVTEVVRDILTEDRAQIAVTLVSAAEKLNNLGDKEECERLFPGLPWETAKANGAAIGLFAALFAIKIGTKPLPIITAALFESKAHQDGTCDCDRGAKPPFPGGKKAGEKETIH